MTGSFRIIWQFNHHLWNLHVIPVEVSTAVYKKPDGGVNCRRGRASQTKHVANCTSFFYFFHQLYTSSPNARDSIRQGPFNYRCFLSFLSWFRSRHLTYALFCPLASCNSRSYLLLKGCTDFSSSTNVTTPSTGWGHQANIIIDQCVCQCIYEMYKMPSTCQGILQKPQSIIYRFQGKICPSRSEISSFIAALKSCPRFTRVLHIWSRIVWVGSLQALHCGF